MHFAVAAMSAVPTCGSHKVPCGKSRRSHLIRGLRLLMFLLCFLCVGLPVFSQESPREVRDWQMHLGDSSEGPWSPLAFAQPLGSEDLGSGIAWFRCDVQGSRQPQAVAFLSRWRAVEVYWDGRRIGGAGHIGSLTEFGPRDRYVVLSLPAEEGQHHLDLRVQVGVHDRLTHSIPSIAVEKPVLAGPEAGVRERAQFLTAAESWGRLKERLPYLILMVIFTVMGLWHLQFFLFRRKAKVLFWFGLVLLCMAIQQFGLGGWPKDWPLPSYRVSQALFVEYYLTCVVFLEFLRNLSGTVSGRWMRRYQWLFLLPLVALFILPPAYSMWFARRIGSMLALPILVVLVVSMVRARREKHPDTPYLFVGTLALLLGGAVEATYFLGLARGVDALGFAFAIFLTCMAGLVNARSATAYEESERLARDLANQIQERERMFSEIHDGFRAQLGDAVQLVGNLAHRSDAGEMSRQLPAVGSILDHCLGELRDLMWILRDGAVTLPDLALHLQDHMALHLIPNGLHLDFSSTFADPERTVSRSLRFHLFRIVQEWTDNTLKHAGASHVALRLQELDGQLAIRYTDDGKGFDENVPFSAGHGLDLMKQRCQQLRALVALRAEPGKGFQGTLHVTLK